MTWLFVGLSVIVTLQRVHSDMMCYDCHAHDAGCDKDPDDMARCEPGTTMCFVKMNHTDIEQIRGCLPKGGRYWDECMVKQSNECFTCFGSACNHMPLDTPSTLHCIQCKGKACESAEVGERCLIKDTLFGPAMCVSKYLDHGKDIELKDCWNAINKTSAGFKRHLHYTCLGQMCNFQKDDVLERCIEYRGYGNKYKPKTRMCMAGSFPQRFSKFMGCHRDISAGDLMWFGCNSYRAAASIALCQASPDCQMCYGDLCNNVTSIYYKNTCHGPNNTTVICEYLDSMCFVHKNFEGVIRMGCVTDTMPGLYNAEVLMCSNNKQPKSCTPTTNIDEYIGCYECRDPPCDNVLANLGHTAKTICPLGTTQCYSSRRADGVTFRGCFRQGVSGNSVGEKICKDSMGACKICSHNYCNYDVVTTLIEGQCYKSNWKHKDHHETSLRLADCAGNRFKSRERNEHCYVASSSRLFMRMGCVSEQVSGIDDSYALTFGSSNVAWLYQNTCYKCESNELGYCFDVKYLKQHKCLGLNQFPVRGCYTLIDRRAMRVERGCVTELTEFMMRLCNMPIFYDKCSVCSDSGCNKEIFGGF